MSQAVFSKTSILDFYGQPGIVAAPPANMARMYYDVATNQLIVVDSSGASILSGGGGTPGGSDASIQYNNSGAFGGFSDGTSHQLLHGGRTFSAVDLTSEVTDILPPANGGAGNFSAAGTGYFFAPYQNQGCSLGASTGWTANRLWVYRFNLPFGLTVRKVSVNVTTLVSSSHVGVALHAADGSLLVTSGALDSSSTGVKTTTLVTPVVVPPGDYWVSFTTDNNGVGVEFFNPGNGALLIAHLNTSATRVGFIASATSGGAPAAFNPASVTASAVSVGGVVTLFES